MGKKKQQEEHFDVYAVLKSVGDHTLRQHLSKLFNGNEKLGHDERDEMWMLLHFVFLKHADIILSPECEKEQEHISTASDADQASSSLTSNKEITAQKESPENATFKSIEIVRAIMQLIRKSLSEWEAVPVAVTQIVCVLGKFLKPSNFITKFKNEIIQLFEMWLKKEKVFQPVMCIEIYTYLLDITASTVKNVLKMDLERIWRFRIPLERLLELCNTQCGKLIQSLAKLPENKHFLRSKDGCNFISFLFTVNKSLVINLYASIKVMLPTAKPTEASAVGEILTSAYLKSSTEQKIVILELCVQNLMSHVFTLPRCGLEMNTLGRNVLTVLTCFHSEKTHPHLRNMLADSYEPLLWRYLSSSNNIHRCNAAQVLFSAYPLQRPGTGGMARSMYEQQQHTAIAELLKDNCHIVRIIAITNVCSLMNTYWLMLPSQWTKAWMKILVLDLSQDGSSADVRRSVLVNLAVLVANRHAFSFMKGVVMKVKDRLHDVCEAVRKAFLQLLLRLKEAGEGMFWLYAPLPHLLARLEVEGEPVGKLIVELLFSSYCGGHLTISIQLKRIMSLIATNQDASRHFFQYSRSVMSMSNACALMCAILWNLDSHVKDCLALDKSIDSSPVIQQLPRLRSKRQRQENVENIHPNVKSIPEPVVEKPAVHSKQNMNNPVIVQGLLDAVGIMWKIHMSETLDTPEERKFLKAALVSVQPLILYYKNIFAVYSSILYLASQLPVSVVTESYNVPGIVFSQLKKLTADAPSDVLLMLISPLCCWNRGDDVVGLAQEWLHEAFTMDQVPSQKNPTMPRHVTFKVHQDPKPQLALNLLDAVFHPSNQTIAITKNYDNILELWKEMDSVKEFIAERLVLDEPLTNELLSDGVLQGCLFWYAKLIPILSKDEPLFDSCENYIELLNWAEESLLPFVPPELPDQGDEVPLVVAMLRHLLLVGHEMVTLMFDDAQYCCCLGAFTKTLLTIQGCNLMFVHNASCVINALTESVKATNGAEDPSRLIRVVVPSLTAALLSVLSEQFYPKAVLMTQIKNFTNLKNVMCNVLLTIEKFYGASSKLKMRLLEDFVRALVKIQGHFLLLSVDELLNMKEQMGTDTPSCKIKCGSARGFLKQSLVSSKPGNSTGTKVVPNMSCMAAQLMGIFLTRPTLGNALIAQLIEKSDSEYKQDKVLTAACSSILNNILTCPGKLATTSILTHLRSVSDQEIPDSTVSVVNELLVTGSAASNNTQSSSQLLTMNENNRMGIRKTKQRASMKDSIWGHSATATRGRDSYLNINNIVHCRCIADGRQVCRVNIVFQVD